MKVGVNTQHGGLVLALLGTDSSSFAFHHDTWGLYFLTDSYCYFDIYNPRLVNTIFAKKWILNEYFEVFGGGTVLGQGYSTISYKEKFFGECLVYLI